MTLEVLRLKHPRFIYQSYDTERVKDELVFRYHFLLEPDLAFAPETRIPFVGDTDIRTLRPFVFHLGLVEAMSYWKAACPPEFIVRAGFLSNEQIRFWRDLFVHGLGEFYYRNNIDFTKPDFFHISVDPEVTEAVAAAPTSERETKTDLVLVGGGKDSAVTVALLKQHKRKFQAMVVNPTQAAMANLLAAGVTDPIIVERSIDERLLRLNEQGYLNGHTPFSALLSFLGVTVGTLYGNDSVVVSNERSADEGNVVFHGVEVNHQYSKSFQYEQAFRGYCEQNFSGAPQYFSFLRPLNDLQIGKLFSGLSVFFPTFRSCNVGSRTNSWCGHCAKCAFTYLTLFPFLSYQDVLSVFGSDYFTNPTIIDHIRALTGLVKVKPFECVGTRKESVLAVCLSVASYKKYGREVPEGLLRIKSDLSVSEENIIELQNEVLSTWGGTYNLQADHLAILKNAWTTRGA